MPLDLQSGSPGEAVRKGFGIRGGISMLVDETIVPVTSVRQLDEAPYRTDGLSGMPMGGASAASVGNFSSIQFLNNGSAGGVDVVVTGFVLSNPNAVVATFRWGWALSLLSKLRDLRTAELAPRGSSLADLLSVSVFEMQAGQAAGTSITTLQGDGLTLQAGDSLYVPCEVLVRPTMGMIFETSIVNSAIAAHVTARLYQPQ